jgi:hypothetical protein
MVPQLSMLLAFVLYMFSTSAFPQIYTSVKFQYATVAYPGAVSTVANGINATMSLLVPTSTGAFQFMDLCTRMDNTRAWIFQGRPKPRLSGSAMLAMLSASIRRLVG